MKRVVKRRHNNAMSEVKVPHLKLSGFDLIWTILALSIALFPLCFILFYVLNTDGIIYISGIPQLPTLSLTGGYWPEVGIFTFLLHSFAVLSFFIFSMISEVLHEKLRSSNNCLLSRFEKKRRALRVINVVLYWVGVSFSIAICITGSIPVTIAPISHAVFAIIMFVLGCAHILIFKFSFGLDGVFRDVSQNFLHLAAVILAVPVNIAALVTAGIVRSSCLDLECKEFSVQIVVIVEYITAIALLLYVGGFIKMTELKETYLIIQLPQRVDDSDHGDSVQEMQEMT